MKFDIKMFLMYTVIFGGSGLVWKIFGFAFLGTFFNWIFGSLVGYYVNLIVISIMFILTVLFFLHRYNSYDAKMKTEYMSAMHGKKYDRKEDIRSIKKSKGYIRACIAIGILSVLNVWLLNSVLVVAVIPIAIFFIRYSYSSLHEQWIEERMYDGEYEQEKKDKIKERRREQ